MFVRALQFLYHFWGWVGGDCRGGVGGGVQKRMLRKSPEKRKIIRQGKVYSNPDLSVFWPTSPYYVNSLSNNATNLA